MKKQVKTKRKVLTSKTEQGEYVFNLTFQNLMCIVYIFYCINICVSVYIFHKLGQFRPLTHQIILKLLNKVPCVKISDYLVCKSNYFKLRKC